LMKCYSNNKREPKNSLLYITIHIYKNIDRLGIAERVIKISCFDLS
jgi:hypothetical protein